MVNDDPAVDAVDRVYGLLRAVASQPDNQELLRQQLRALVPDFNRTALVATASTPRVSAVAGRASGPMKRAI
jgi:hypothetical protein